MENTNMKDSFNECEIINIIPVFYDDEAISDGDIIVKIKGEGPFRMFFPDVRLIWKKIKIGDIIPLNIHARKECQMIQKEGEYIKKENDIIREIVGKVIEKRKSGLLISANGILISADYQENNEIIIGVYVKILNPNPIGYLPIEFLKSYH